MELVSIGVCFRLTVKLQQLLARQPQISLRTLCKRLVVSLLMRAVCGGMQECVSSVLKNVRFLVRVLVRQTSSSSF